MVDLGFRPRVDDVSSDLTRHANASVKSCRTTHHVPGSGLE
jgi:hypothetical protein